MKVRKFEPGTEWFYIKIYSGIKTSDLVLEEVIFPLVHQLKEKNQIHKWFFIRYHDPKSHLRVRFHLKDTMNFAAVVLDFNDKVKVHINSGEISEIMMDTYKRETERYGEKTIASAEELFHNSSELYLNFLAYDDREKIMVTMYYVDQIFSELQLATDKKLEWITQYNDSFKKEFNSDRNLNNQLSKKYRDFKSSYLHFTDTPEFEQVKNIILLNIKICAAPISNIINNKNEIKLEYFFQSIFHMHINRTFTSNQRLFEMIIYDYLWRYYKSQNALRKNC